MSGEMAGSWRSSSTTSQRQWTLSWSVLASRLASRQQSWSLDLPTLKSSRTLGTTWWKLWFLATKAFQMRTLTISATFQSSLGSENQMRGDDTLRSSMCQTSSTLTQSMKMLVSTRTSLPNLRKHFWNLCRKKMKKLMRTKKQARTQ